MILSKGRSRIKCAWIGFSFSFFKDPPLRTKARLLSLPPASLSQWKDYLQLLWKQNTNAEHHWKLQVLSWGRECSAWTSTSESPVTSASTESHVRPRSIHSSLTLHDATSVGWMGSLFTSAERIQPLPRWTLKKPFSHVRCVSRLR